MSESHDLCLHGLDGSNPLGFLAALGTLRILATHWQHQRPQLYWERRGGWRATLRLREPASEEAISSVLAERLAGRDTRPEFHELGDDLTIAPTAFRDFARQAMESATMADRETADFLAAFGADSHVGPSGQIQDTAFRTMAGAGHQHFLAFMRNIIGRTTAEHLHKALFAPWRYDDPVQNATLRWDPVDDVRYALRARNPSGDPVRTTGGSVLGANRLAIEALPMFPTAPGRDRVITTGFQGERASNTFFRWPIWTHAASVDVVRSLLALSDLQANSLDRKLLSHRGVAEVFQSQRLTVGKVRNFTPGCPV